MAGGQGATASAGSVGLGVSVRLRSRKGGAGSATAALTGQSATMSQGAVGFPAQPAWISTPSPVYTAGVASNYNLGLLVSNYNSFTDVFTLAPGSVSLPTWLSLQGSLLVANGTQTEVEDFTGLLIKVTRSGWLSATSAIISVSVVGGEPTWSGLPATYNFTYGVVGSFNLATYAANFNPSLHEMVLTGGTLPTGITLNATGSLNYNGIGAVVSPAALEITIKDVVVPIYGEAGDAFTTWLYSDKNSAIAWDNSGGDWLDSNGTSQGSTPFNTIVFPNNTPGTVVQAGVKEMVQYLLANGNHGMCIRTAPGGSVCPAFANLYNSTYQHPQLQVVTNQGTFNCACTSAVWVDPSAGNSLATQGFARSPGFMRFDLSAVTGIVSSATITLTVVAGSAGPFPFTVNVFATRPPRIYYAPEVEIGGVQQGIANTVANDLALASHPSVLWYASNWGGKTMAQIQSEWATHGFWNYINNQTLVAHPEYGLTFVEAHLAPGTGPSIMTAGTYISPSQGYPWQRALGAGYDELYLRYMLYVDERNRGAYGDGMKLPGMEGTYQFGYTSGGSPQSDSSPDLLNGGTRSNWWDGRMGHHRYSTQNPGIYPFYWHQYSPDWPYSQHPSEANFTYPTNFRAAFRDGRVYCCEQYVKLNTSNDNGITWNQDGIFRFWLNGVQCHNITGQRFRLIAKSGTPWNGIQVALMIFLNLYQGGTGSSIGDLYYQIGGIVAASEYIGPPKVIA